MRAFKINDLEDLYEITSDHEVTEFLTWETHKNIEQTKESIEKRFIPNVNMFAIELLNEKKCIGCIDFRVDSEHDKAGFGYMLNRKYWNNGYMTETLELTIKVLFEKYKVNRIESTYYVGNEASGVVMKKCGMNYEGTSPQQLKIKGKYVDVVQYGILARDYFKELND
ncbi:MAG: GNAT family N-acetyltransferase [Spirochaetales bacterium]|nr:GNAT family N-acetyltransferase [Spirochaetales bacterium]